jgi:hypothetical protein
MQTPTIRKIFILLSLVILVSGCENALYFYETEKISLTVEARPDSTQPVQGSLGLKQRVVLITPPKKDENVIAAMATSDGTPPNKNDALSAISSFSFKTIPIDWEFNPILIQTAFITGKAAAELGTFETANAARAITVGDVKTSGAHWSIMRNLVDSQKENGTEEGKKHLNLLDGLGKAVIPANYPVPIFRLDSGTSTLEVMTPEGSPVNYTDIDSALSYWGKLEGSADKLKSVLSAPELYKFGDIQVTNEMVKAGLQQTYEKTERELKRLRQELAGNAIYTDAIQYYVDKYIKNAQGE